MPFLGSALGNAYADIDPAEIFGVGGDRVSEGKELDLHRFIRAFFDSIPTSCW